ncbi:MAG: queuosine precursor transporter [Planctomycetes bacterium]|nr:queuosine precursor transporter [Planctomycetota bacterium]MCB9916706.1 queuosine precursor transporter [Planctomycetota bacterium]
MTDDTFADDHGGPAPRVGLPGHPPHAVPEVPQSTYEHGYLVIASLFIAMLMLTNIIGTKLFALPLDLPVLGGVLRAAQRAIEWLLPGEGVGDSLTLTAGIVTYPITFLCTDIVSEVYGRRRADRMVVLGFAASVLMLGCLWMGKSLPPSDFWTVPERLTGAFHPDVLAVGADGTSYGTAQAAQAAYAFTFDAPGVLLFASMLAYLVAQLVDNRLFHFWRGLTKGRHLWFRNNASTTISQLVDTAIVNGIFLRFYFEMEWPRILGIILAVYAVKFLLALADTPLCYLGVWWVGRYARASRVSPRCAG